MEKYTHISGQDHGKVMLYALSTCIWCRKVKKLLNDLGVAYDYCDVDQLEGDLQAESEAEIMKWNPKVSFPTLVIHDETTIVGFDETKIRGELEK